MKPDIAIQEDVFSVLLVEDHELTRKGIKAMLADDQHVRLVGEAATAQDAISLVQRLQPDVVILDIQLRQGTGMDVSRNIKTLAPDSKILVLTAHEDDRYVISMARLGVDGYLLKSASAQELVKALRQVAAGSLVFGPSASNTVKALLARNSGRWDGSTETRSLTARETEVLQHLREGRMNHEIGSEMCISTKTVETHVANLLRKLGAQNRTQAVSKSGDIGIREV